MYTFDVFISCKSEDYGLAREVYTFLVRKGYRVFLADTELKKNGNADYGKVIDFALESAKHFILVSSNKKYIQSPYVESEWRTFIEEIRSGRKKGNLLTVLKGLDVGFLPISLRKYQSFQYQDFSLIIDYLPLEYKKENIREIENIIVDKKHKDIRIPKLSICICI